MNNPHTRTHTHQQPFRPINKLFGIIVAERRWRLSAAQKTAATVMPAMMLADDDCVIAISPRRCAWNRPTAEAYRRNTRARTRSCAQVDRKTHTHATRCHPCDATCVCVDWNAKLQQYNTRALLRDCHEQLSVRSNTRAGRAHKITRALSKKPGPRRARVGFRLADWGRERAFAGTSFTPTIAHTSAERLPAAATAPVPSGRNCVFAVRAAFTVPHALAERSR